MTEKGIGFKEITIKDAHSIEQYDVLKCEDTFYLVDCVKNKLLYFHVFENEEEALEARNSRLRKESIWGYSHIFHFEEFFSDDAKIEIWDKTTMVQDEIKEAIKKMAHPVHHKKVFDHSYYQNHGDYANKLEPWIKFNKYAQDRIFKGDIIRDLSGCYFVIEDIDNNPIDDDCNFENSDHVHVSFTRHMLLSDALDERNQIILGKPNLKDCELDSWNWFFEDLEDPFLLPLIEFDQYNLCDKCSTLIWVHGFTDNGAGVCEECDHKFCNSCAEWDYDTGDCKDCVDKKEND